MAELGLVVGRERLPDDVDLDFLEPCLMGRFLTADEQGRSEVLPDPTADLPQRPIRGAAILFPGALRLSDPAFDLAGIAAHLERAGSSLGAVAEPGAWVVLGSGASRRIPEHVAREDGLTRLAEVVRQAQTILADHGLEVMLEPLRQQESNVFTTLDETADFMDAHGFDLRMVCDTFHLFSEGLTVADALPHLDRIGHVHLSGHDRLPVSQDADAVLDAAVALQEAGYHGRWSFECHWDEAGRDLAASIAVTRERLR